MCNFSFVSSMLKLNDAIAKAITDLERNRPEPETGNLDARSFEWFRSYLAIIGNPVPLYELLHDGLLPSDEDQDIFLETAYDDFSRKIMLLEVLYQHTGNRWIVDVLLHQEPVHLYLRGMAVTSPDTKLESYIWRVAGLRSAARMQEMLQNPVIRDEYNQMAVSLWNEYTKVRTEKSSESTISSLLLAVTLDVADTEAKQEVQQYIAKDRADDAPETNLLFTEAAFRLGDPGKAFEHMLSHPKPLKRAVRFLMGERKKDISTSLTPSHVRVLIEHCMGVTPAAPGWSVINFNPALPDSLQSLDVTLPIPRGRVRIRYDHSAGFELDVPPDVLVTSSIPGAHPFHVCEVYENGPGKLTETQIALFEKYDWDAYASEENTVWVSVQERMFRILRKGYIIWEVPCSTASAGTGSQKNSYQTPLGKHSVRTKVGDNAPWGRIFISRGDTGRNWQTGEELSRDLVLTRIMWLTGEEPGLNQGGTVDSYQRYIYIHGTNGEADIGTPASHGCIRLRNHDVIEAYDRIPLHTSVLITEE